MVDGPDQRFFRAAFLAASPAINEVTRGLPPAFTPGHAATVSVTVRPAAGVHFVVFNPTSDDFNRTRLAMDGVLPDGTRLPFEPRARGQGLNSVLRTTHRQNFLVPPLSRRSFPLVELLR